MFGKQIGNSNSHKVRLEMNNDRVTAKHKVNVQDFEGELDVDVEDGAVFGILSHGALCLQHDVLCM